MLASLHCWGCIADQETARREGCCTVSSFTASVDRCLRGDGDVSTVAVAAMLLVGVGAGGRSTLVNLSSVHTARPQARSETT
jgi:hypothetical protein